jgi:LysR family nitrogen assimilation transcriptional regulator
MDLRQFRYFIQAAKRQNFRRAAEDLRVAQSALTRQVQYLEHELGFLLFDRVKRGVRLTAAGQRLLERSQLILVEGWTSNAMGQVRRGELSLAIVTDPPPDPLLEYVRLFTESIYLVGRPDDAWLKKRSIEVKNLGDLPLVMTSKSNRTRQLIENKAAREGARLDVRLELESPETLQQLLLSGRIYGLLPYSSIYHGAQTRRLGAVPIRGLAMTRYLAKSRSEVTSIACETLEKTVMSEMRELAKRLSARERG